MDSRTTRRRIASATHSHSVHRQLSANELTSSIPSQIGQLTALQTLFVQSVVVVCRSTSLACVLAHDSLLVQRPACQSTDVIDSVTNRQSGGVELSVREISAAFVFAILTSLLNRRYLETNQLKSSIPSQIGRLMALLHLFVQSISLSSFFFFVNRCRSLARIVSLFFFSDIFAPID